MQNEILGGRYQLQDSIGRGGMAVIYRGYDLLDNNRPVAVKVLREAYSTDPKFVIRFQREGKAAASLHHQNIVRVDDYGQSGGSYYIVMELVDGSDLRRYLRSRVKLDVERAVIIAHDVAMGLSAAHRRGIVHRDVKPQNILIGRDGSIKLTDFGIASVYKDINAERLTTTGMTLGTVQYYAPEQAQGEIVSAAADVYALGIVMYEMLTGRPPFDGDTPVAVAMQHLQDAPIPPSQYNPNIPPALEEIIMRCLEKTPEMRYRDGGVLARALEIFVEEVLGKNVAPTISSSGSSPSLPGNPVPPPVPPRPGGSRGGGTPQVGTSSPNNVLTSPPVSPPYSPAGQVYLPDQQAVGATMQAAGGQMDYAAPTIVNGTPSMPGFGQGQLAPYAPVQDLPPGSGSTRPFSLDPNKRSGTVQEQESRVASIITVLILFATLLLLGFSIYLAGMLGFLPFSTNKNATPTTVVQSVTVPNFVGLSYAVAKQQAADVGLTLSLEPGSPSHGWVKRQSIVAGRQTAKGSPIEVLLTTVAPASPTATLTVPQGLIGKTLQDAENMLLAANISYVVQSAGTDTGLGTNIVKNTNPPPGSPLQAGQNVTLYIANCTGCVQTSPVASPTGGASPTPTGVVSPTPTSAPSPTPTTAPTSTPTSAPSPTPTTAPTSTPTSAPSPTPDPTP